MCDIFRKGVPKGAEMRVWIEPVDTEDREYRTTARLRGPNQKLFWNDEVITQSDKENPKTLVLNEDGRYVGSIRTIFASDNSVKVINEIWVFEDNEWRRHGGRKICTVFPTDEIEVADVFLYIRMA